MRESRRGGERERGGMKMQKGAGGLAQYRSGGASAFILFFVRRRVARSFLQDGRAARARPPACPRARRCKTSVTRAPREATNLYLADRDRNATSALRCVACWSFLSARRGSLGWRLRYWCERSARSFARRDGSRRIGAGAGTGERTQSKKHTQHTRTRARARGKEKNRIYWND